MGVITQSIGSAGGRDFSSWAAWNAALPADLVANGNSYVAEGYNDSEFIEASIFITPTTDASHTITLQCHAGQSFRDNVNAQTNALGYAQANGVAVRNTNSFATLFFIESSNCFLNGLQIKTDSTTSAQTIAGDGGLTNIIVENCILDNGSGQMGNFGWIYRNDLIICRTGNCTVSNFNSAWYNCTFVVPSDLSNTNGAITCVFSPTVTVENCAFFGFSAINTGGTPTMTGSNNCADIAIGFGSANQASKTYANQFVGTTTSAMDFKLKTGSDCVDNGVTDTTNAAHDIVGTARPQGSAYDISAWELVQAVTKRFFLIPS